MGQSPPDDFDAQVISAFGEAFNNIALHGYAGRGCGEIVIQIDIASDAITIHMADTGRTYDPFGVPAPPLERLPESGMGLYIIKSFMDSVTYSPGNPPETPNVLCLHKRRRPPQKTAAVPAHGSVAPSGDREQ